MAHELMAQVSCAQEAENVVPGACTCSIFFHQTQQAASPDYSPRQLFSRHLRWDEVSNGKRASATFMLESTSKSTPANNTDHTQRQVFRRWGRLQSRPHKSGATSVPL